MASPIGRDDAPRADHDDPRGQGPRVRRRDRARPAAQPAPAATAACCTGPRSRPDPASAASCSGRADSAEGEGAADALERWMRKLEAEREALELGRLAYVAVTARADALHLVGSAQVKEGDAGTVLVRPQSASLLGFLWPVLSPHFERKLAERVPGAPGGAARTPTPGGAACAPHRCGIPAAAAARARHCAGAAHRGRVGRRDSSRVRLGGRHGAGGRRGRARRDAAHRGARVRPRLRLTGPLARWSRGLRERSASTRHTCRGALNAYAGS